MVIKAPVQSHDFIHNESLRNIDYAMTFSRKNVDRQGPPRYSYSSPPISLSNK